MSGLHKRVLMRRACALTQEQQAVAAVGDATKRGSLQAFPPLASSECLRSLDTRREGRSLAPSKRRYVVAFCENLVTAPIGLAVAHAGAAGVGGLARLASVFDKHQQVGSRRCP